MLDIADVFNSSIVWASTAVDQPVAQAAARYITAHCADAADILAALGIEARP